MSAALQIPAAVEIRLGAAPLPAKLSVIGAALAAIRAAHGDTMRPECWASVHDAERAIAKAMLLAG